MKLSGYVRSDGRIGFRNHVLVVPLTGCLAEIARRVAQQVEGVTCLAHVNGCDLQGEDAELFATVLEHTATHPNVGGVIFLTMGCAAALRFRLPAKVKESGRLVRQINTQELGGTSKTIEASVAVAREMVAELATVGRTPVPFAGLTIGTKCGASDSNSFQYCHPVVGKACDLLVKDGATIVLSEDCELTASANKLARRAINPETGASIRAMARNVNRMWKKRFGYTLTKFALDHGQSLSEWKSKSDRHAAKAGTSPITGFFDMAEIVRGPGLVILNAPNTDLECVTCLAAAGCNVTIFTTGRGTPVGSPTAITLKVTATQRSFEIMNENIDLCVGPVIDGSETMDQAAQRVVQAVIEAANGHPTKAESLHHWEVAMPIRGVTF